MLSKTETLFRMWHRRAKTPDTRWKRVATTAGTPLFPSSITGNAAKQYEERAE